MINFLNRINNFIFNSFDKLIDRLEAEDPHMQAERVMRNIENDRIVRRTDRFSGALKATHYVVFNGASHFVKDADFFISQGGLIEDWGRRWRPVVAKSLEDARQISETLDWASSPAYPRGETLFKTEPMDVLKDLHNPSEENWEKLIGEARTVIIDGKIVKDNRHRKDLEFIVPSEQFVRAMKEWVGEMSFRAQKRMSDGTPYLGLHETEELYRQIRQYLGEPYVR